MEGINIADDLKGPLIFKQVAPSMTSNDVISEKTFTGLPYALCTGPGLDLSVLLGARENIAVCGVAPVPASTHRVS